MGESGGGGDRKKKIFGWVECVDFFSCGREKVRRILEVKVVAQICGKSQLAPGFRQEVTKNSLFSNLSFFFAFSVSILCLLSLWKTGNGW